MARFLDLVADLLAQHRVPASTGYPPLPPQPLQCPQCLAAHVATEVRTGLAALLPSNARVVEKVTFTCNGCGFRASYKYDELTLELSADEPEPRRLAQLEAYGQQVVIR